MGGDAKKSSKRSSSKTKEKEKDREKDKARDSSKREKRDSKRKGTSTSNATGATPSAAEPSTKANPPTPSVVDPDAVHLFRRYDQLRCGQLSRTAFLELLRDYAEASAQTTRSCALTDSPGAPLGYAQSTRNSEFEAGQLFARYDTDHTGALSMEQFMKFFLDFQVQLRSFAQDLSYASVTQRVQSTVSSDRAKEMAATYVQTDFQEKKVEQEQEQDGEDGGKHGDMKKNVTRSRVETRKDMGDKDKNEMMKEKYLDVMEQLREKYEKLLWKLRRICKEDLVLQRDRLEQQMEQVRQYLRHLQQNFHPPFAWKNAKDEQLKHHVLDLYDAIGQDLADIDDTLSWTRSSLQEGVDHVSEDQIESMVQKATKTYRHAQLLAMRQYELPEAVTKASAIGRSEPGQSSKAEPEAVMSSQHVPSKESSGANGAQSAKDDNGSQYSSRVHDMERLLRVKDQMIFELLKERTQLRKEKQSMETYLEELSSVSTSEMQKWAALTDEMQREIEFLRHQLSRSAVMS